MIKKNNEIAKNAEEIVKEEKVEESIENTKEIESNVEEAKENIDETKEKNIEEYISVRKTPWHDFEDNNFKYEQGDKYPRDGYNPSKERIKELFDYRKNKLGEVLIIKKKDLEEE